jgi:hypothetical protein
MKPSPRRRRWSVATLAMLALVGAILSGVHAPQRMLPAYLAAWLFALAPALGSVPMLMIAPLTGGRWSLVLHAPLLAATRVLPLLALLALPILAGMRWLYPWLHPESLADADFARQRWYLDPQFFVARALGCFVLWTWLASSVQRRWRDAGASGVTPRFAAIGLIVYALSISVAAVDWIGSLVPAWHSSTLGLIVGVGQLLGAASLAVFCVAAGAPRIEPARLRDTGQLLLMLLLAWSYLAFMDYLTAWTADLPAETVWYLPRLNTSWHWLGAGVLLLDLALPFVVLLSRRAKQHPQWMRIVAGMLLLAQAGFAGWLVWPDVRPHGFSLTWNDLLAWIGVSGLCWALFDLRLAQARDGAVESP